MGSGTPRVGVAIAIAIAGCVGPLARPKTNEIVAKAGGRHVVFRGMIASATFCPTCGRDAPVVITYGAPAKYVITIPLCYAHAALKLDGSGKDRPTVSDEIGHVTSTDGELDITDCIASHVTGKLQAFFENGERIDAVIDTPLVTPGSPMPGVGSGSN